MSENDETDKEIEWETDDGVSIRKIRDDNNSCIGKEDHITYETIVKGDEIKFDAQCYSRKALLKWFEISNTLPHNRRVISNWEFNHRDYRGGVKKRKTRRNKNKKSAKTNMKKSAKKSRKSRK